MASIAGTRPKAFFAIFVNLPYIPFIDPLTGIITTIVGECIVRSVELVYPAKPGRDPDIVFEVPGDVRNKVTADRRGIRGMYVFSKFVLPFIPAAQACPIRSDPQV